MTPRVDALLKVLSSLPQRSTPTPAALGEDEAPESLLALCRMLARLAGIASLGRWELELHEVGSGLDAFARVGATPPAGCRCVTFAHHDELEIVACWRPGEPWVELHLCDGEEQVARRLDDLDGWLGELLHGYDGTFTARFSETWYEGGVLGELRATARTMAEAARARIAEIEAAFDDSDDPERLLAELEHLERVVADLRFTHPDDL